MSQGIQGALCGRRRGQVRNDFMNSPKKLFIVRKRFTTGTLKDMTLDDRTPVQFAVGFVVKANAWTGPGYVVEACDEIGILQPQ